MYGATSVELFAPQVDRKRTVFGQIPHQELFSLLEEKTIRASLLATFSFVPETSLSKDKSLFSLLPPLLEGVRLKSLRPDGKPERKLPHPKVADRRIR